MNSPGHGPTTFWLVAVGVLMLAIGVLFFALPHFTEMPLEDGLGMAAIFGVVALILLGVAVIMGRGMREAARLRREGIDGEARVLSAGQTGMYLNKQPQLELELEISTRLHGKYQATMKAFVPLILMSSVTSGQPLPVKVDRTDRNRFTVDWENVGAGASPGLSFGGATMSASTIDIDASQLADVLKSRGITLSPDATNTLTQMGLLGGNSNPASVSVPSGASSPSGSPVSREATRQRVLMSGIPANGTVLSSAHTGEIDDEGKPVYEVALFIQAPGSTPVQGGARVGVPLERIARLQPGNTLPLKIDPSDRMTVVVDWDSDRG